MFEAVATADLLTEVRAHDFTSDPIHEAGGNRIDAVREIDRAVRALQAEQATQIAALHAERSAVMTLGRGDPTLSVIGEVAMARNIGPCAAATQVGLSLGLARLPRVLELFRDGRISEPVARAVVNESCSLHADDFVVLDGEIAAVLPGLTHLQARQAAARAVIRIDADAARIRAERNRADQRVSMFPETDGVAILQMRGPAEQILAAFNTLDAEAHRLRAAGDTRTIGQIMCQTSVERVTGLVRADGIDVEVGLVLDAPTLVGEDGEPVELLGYGPIAPSVADDIIAAAPNRSVRRLLVDPVDGTLVVREPHRRHFDSPTRHYIRTRDQQCRQPGCDGRIRDADHIVDHALGGLSTTANGQGLCKRSHTLKHQPDWKVVSDGKATIWTTPTGHSYRSSPPPLLPRAALGHLRQ
ncbi:HNH endonuclease [Aeromicrobium sp. A1-2]|uniref:HNH endonuclease n=1 Tax=Aeromicrobium sp. A1-2 TaxID=2107713 RepID=UPI000E50C563|nr:HNH endonuclease [Aeromicrobium sp. A1-2]AXT86588.1 HNH endonuclease [Aeromicrobium sp. A1-2]